MKIYETTPKLGVKIRTLCCAWGSLLFWCVPSSGFVLIENAEIQLPKDIVVVDEKSEAGANDLLAATTIKKNADGRMSYQIDDMIFAVRAYNEILSAFTGTKWPNGIVYYEYDANVTADYKSAFTNGLEEWSSRTGVKFIEGRGNGNYVHVVNALENSSQIGMIGGEQILNMRHWYSSLTVAHELGHALGLHHEHCRSDRDNYVIINAANILPGMEPNFYLNTSSINYGIYDFESIMHYAKNEFAKPATLTIQPLPAYSDKIEVMGNYTELSRADMDGMVMHYDDYFEDNDGAAQAHPLANGRPITYYAHGGRASQQDEDWFVTQKGADESTYYVFKCLFSHADGDINMQIYSNNTLLATANSTTDNETIELVLAGNYEYKIRIYGSNSKNVYDLYYLATPDVASIEIGGPTGVEENSGAQLTCLAHYRNGSTRDVSGQATWTDYSQYAQINSSGYLTTYEVPSDEPCQIAAIYAGEYDGHDLTIWNVLAIPPNDKCSGAIILSDGVSYTMDTAGATSADDPIIDCAPGFKKGVWFKVAPATSGGIQVSTSGSGYETALAIYSGACGSLSEIACGDDDIIIVGEAGATYYIQAGGYSSTGGMLRVTATSVNTPANDQCSGAVTLSDGVPHAVNTINASSIGDPSPLCQDNFGKGVWYKIVPLVKGGISVDTFGSDFDTVLEVFPGSCGGVLRLPGGCNDDAEAGIKTSRVVFDGTVGTTYYILAGGYDGASGMLTVTADFNNAPTAPTLINPENESANQGLTPTLQASAYFDPDGNAHTNSQWQIDDNGDFSSCVWDSGDGAAAAITTMVPAGKLGYGKTYFWRVRYKDSEGAWSSWAEPFSFTTQAPFSYYVAASRPDDSGDGLSWATAKKSIQAAIDVTATGDVILVTNGTYGPIVSSNRAIIIQSINGATETILDGGSSRRCASLARGTTSGDKNTVLIGFTLQNGFTTNYGGGAAGGTLNSCIVTGNSAGRGGGGAYGGTLNDCIVTGNTAISSGGGAERCILNNCTLTGNSAGGSGGGISAGASSNCTISGNSCGLNGGGASGAALTNCTLTGNTAGECGGGSDFGKLVNCTLIGNSCGSDGGGSYGGTLNNCTLTGNIALSSGGGACDTALNNCLLMNNSAPWGGGACDGTLINCTISGNSSYYGGGVSEGLLINCIVWGNICVASETANNYADTTLNYCCTLPTPTNGMGNISADPLLVDPEGGRSEIRVGSPCIDAGLTNYVVGSTDVAGNPRIQNGQVDMGAYEGGTAGHVIKVRMQGTGIVMPGTQVVPTGGSATFTATGTERIFNGYYTNGMYASSANTFKWNNIVADGVLVAAFESKTFYVDASRINDSGAGTSWATATKTIQRAIDMTVSGEAIVVTNGFYPPIMTSNKSIAIQSVNGGGATIIDGGMSRRCATLGNGYWQTNTSLTGFTLRNGYASEFGGGSFGGTLHNCILAENTTYSDTLTCGGGGAFGGMLHNCLLYGNTSDVGGGAAVGKLINCTLAENKASLLAGGVFGGTLINSIVWGNSLTNGVLDNHSNCSVEYSCTTPMPMEGNGNITNDPLFEAAATRNYRVQHDSPCLDAGWNSNAVGLSDLDGKPRVINGQVDMGAYELFNATIFSPVPVPYTWLQTNGLVPNGATAAQCEAAAMKTNAPNRYPAWAAYLAGLSPVSSGEFLSLISLSNGSPKVGWTPNLGSVRTYRVEGKSNMPDAVWYFPTNAGSRFFRVKVALPD